MSDTEKMTRWKELEVPIPPIEGTPSDAAHPNQLMIDQVWADTTRCFFMSSRDGFVTTNLNRLKTPRCADIDDYHIFTDGRETGAAPLMMRSLAYQMAAQGAQELRNDVAESEMMWPMVQAFGTENMTVYEEGHEESALPITNEQLVASIARSAARYRERERLSTARLSDFKYWGAVVDLTPATLDHITQAPLSNMPYNEVASPYPGDVHFPEGWDGSYPVVPKPLPSGCAMAE